ncbi:ABC-type nitrate/sulfonate/bicarbonate transport system, permease component [Methanosarcina barkeri 3]|uniref:ABC-type nitrate/sulfonate/bicarbonate transport system, permease component n=1 Tax=Methanosarcina barkeri 3 TaxID=1434107 RepID=A0A0E3SKG1_METBA|nr:ABC transporter permease [Methanosarcina barkeri]AKB81417.1 ABC-type nitrate/sulfonate/bicarbonate transport system, permease component [Methanosarcina barkeri 3]
MMSENSFSLGTIIGRSGIISSNGFRSVAIFAILFATLIMTVGFPDSPDQAVSDNRAFVAFLLLITTIYGAKVYLNYEKIVSTTDIFLIISLGLFLWELLFGKLSLLDSFIFPGPAKVFMVFQTDTKQMIEGIVSSLGILFAGYFLALALAIPIGLYAGWKKRLFDVTYPIAKTVSPIPATVYLPYSLVLLPTFRASSIFLIFIGAFWPILVGCVNGVFSVDSRLINSARTLDLSDYQMVRKILLPAALPSIFSGAMIGLILSFITLTVAEMIAATSGLGWYIQYYHQFANYDKVTAGMILMIAVVIGIMNIFDRIQKHFLRWHPTYGEGESSAASL